MLFLLVVVCYLSAALGGQFYIISIFAASWGIVAGCVVNAEDMVGYTFQMRVVYTFCGVFHTERGVGYTFQMRVVYTSHSIAIPFVSVGYTFQMRVVYTFAFRFYLFYLVGYTFQMRVVYTENAS